MNKSKRRAVIAGNWKMNLDRKAAKTFITELKPKVEGAACSIVLCVPFTDLETALSETQNSNIAVGAQNCHFAESGAYTGEISANMLRELGVQYVVIGHSERRQYFAETDETVNLRAKAALNAGLSPIICVGETLKDRERGVTAQIIQLQTKIALKDVSKEELKRVIIAYEPVWAIGTGKTATAEQAAEGCALIRKTIAWLYDEESAAVLTIQYGGSMNPKNAAELLGKEDVDGGLIGGASLKSEDFSAIVDAASKG